MLGDVIKALKSEERKQIEMVIRSSLPAFFVLDAGTYQKSVVCLGMLLFYFIIGLGDFSHCLLHPVCDLSPYSVPGKNRTAQRFL